MTGKNDSLSVARDMSGFVAHNLWGEYLFLFPVVSS
jgi:hypothetical protein